MNQKQRCRYCADEVFQRGGTRVLVLTGDEALWFCCVDCMNAAMGAKNVKRWGRFDADIYRCGRWDRFDADVYRCGAGDER